MNSQETYGQIFCGLKQKITQLETENFLLRLKCNQFVNQMKKLDSEKQCLVTKLLKSGEISETLNRQLNECKLKHDSQLDQMEIINIQAINKLRGLEKQIETLRLENIRLIEKCSSQEKEVTSNLKKKLELKVEELSKQKVNSFFDNWKLQKDLTKLKEENVKLLEKNEEFSNLNELNKTLTINFDNLNKKFNEMMEQGIFLVEKNEFNQSLIEHLEMILDELNLELLFLKWFTSEFYPDCKIKFFAQKT